MKLSAHLKAVLEALRREGRPRLVGGCVRDWLRGEEAHDFDVEVAGVDFERLHRTLAPFGATDVVGRSFGVIKLRLKEGEVDFSIPRRESKTGAGHRGFRVTPEPGLSDEEAAGRRDFTINAMAYDPFEGRLIDPFGGAEDLRRRVLRHTGSAFAEDPLRVLRAFQFAGRFDLKLAPETVELAKSIRGTFAELAVERVWGEWAKWAEKAVRPSRGLAVLRETGWLEHFPEIGALVGCEQDAEWHPEGDVWTHTGYCCDAMAGLTGWRDGGAGVRRVLMLATLGHDLGKPGTTRREWKEGRWRVTSPGHEGAGVRLVESFLRRIGAPSEYAGRVGPLVANHMVHHHGGAGGFGAGMVRRLARRLAPATVDELGWVMVADCLGRPPREDARTLELIQGLRGRAAELAVVADAPRPLLKGRHLIEAGLRPGPRFKAVLDAAFEVQLDGGFGDEAGALMWLRNFLQVSRDPSS